MIRSVSVAAIVGVIVSVSQVQAQGFLDVNAIRVQSAQTDDQSYTYVTTLSQEVALFGSTYPKFPAVAGLDVSGGYLSKIGLGLEVHLDFAQYKSTVGLQAYVPSPYFFNTPGVASTVTGGQLDRRDIGVNIGAAYRLPLPTDRVILRVSGGPTYFNVNNEMVSIIRYTQSASSLLRLNLVNITGYETRTEKGSALGYHVGADVGVFFSRHFGVGGVIRYSHGKITLTDPLSGDDADLKVGNTTVGGGLRVRF